MNKLYKKLQSADESERIYAIDDMTENMNDEVFENFLERLKIESSQLVKDKLVMHMEAALAEQKVGGGSVFARVFALYLAHNAYLRSSAIQILSAGNNAVAKFLSANYADSNADVRKLIVDTLAEIGNDIAKKAIRKALYDKDINVRITAIEHLGNLKDIDSAPQLISMLQSSEKEMLSMSVCASIEQISNTQYMIEAINILLPDKNIDNINGLYFSSVLSLIAKCWEKQELLEVLKTQRIKNNYENYQVEMVNFLTTANARFPELINENIVIYTIVELLKAENMDDKMPFIALSLLENSNNQTLRQNLNEYYSSEDIDIKNFSKKIVAEISEEYNF